MRKKSNKPDYWPEAIAHLSKDPVMADIISNYHGETLVSRGAAFQTLARSIVGQQISVKAADSVWKRLAKEQPELSHAHILPLSDEELRACGLSTQKINYLKGLAGYFEREGHGLDWHTLPDSEVDKVLLELKGIGKWTVQMFKIFYLQRPDEFPIADIGLQKAIRKYYGKNKKREITLGQMEKMAAKLWKPYRTVATWYLWRSLDPLPVEY